MTFGISALMCRLDADLPRSDGVVDWARLLESTGGIRPAFVGKYLTGGPFAAPDGRPGGGAWRWVHGEATTLLDPLLPGASLVLVPLQAADEVRQAEGGPRGRAWGRQDGAAMVAAVQAGLDVGDFALAADQLAYVYLEVGGKTALSPEYWGGWATAVTTGLSIGTPPAGRIAVPMQRLLPCIATAFMTVAGPAPSFTVPGPVRAALENAVAVSWHARCHGFWATTDPSQAASALNWDRFTRYDQPQRSGPALQVPVRIWRHARWNSPDHPADTIGLEATRADLGGPDAELAAMLTLNPWIPNPSTARPTTIGVDRGRSLVREAPRLTTRRLTVSHLPEPGEDPGSVRPRLNPPLQERTSFAVRYYSAGPTDAGQPPPSWPKDLTADEAAGLSRAGLDVIACFQTRDADFDALPAYLADPAHGTRDGFGAGWFAANVMGQPPHTPIYFGVDCDVSRAGGAGMISYRQLREYFEQVHVGLQDYIARADPATRVPYAVGVYGCARAFEVLYPLGLASHFWQATPVEWGDEVPHERSNLPTWRHANIHQVALDRNSAVQVASGLFLCSPVVAWLLLIDDRGGPPAFRVTAGARQTDVAFPPALADVVTATGGDVRIVQDLPGFTTFRIEFPVDARPVPFAVASLNAAPDDLKVGFGELGFADLNVAWGDSGGWRVPEVSF